MASRVLGLSSQNSEAFFFFSREALGNLTNKFQRLLRLVNFYKIPLNLATSLPTTKKSETSEKINQKDLEWYIHTVMILFGSQHLTRSIRDRFHPQWERTLIIADRFALGEIHVAVAAPPAVHKARRTWPVPFPQLSQASKKGFWETTNTEQL